MSAAEALEQPRFHDQLVPNVISFEWGLNRTKDEDEDKGEHRNQIRPQAETGIGTGQVRGYNNDTVAFMVSRGHNVSWVPTGYSSAQALRLCWNGTWEAAGEPRQMASGGIAV